MARKPEEKWKENPVGALGKVRDEKEIREGNIKYKTGTACS